MLKLKPLRKPRANQISTSIFFYSHKLQRQVWCESNLEWDVAILLEHDPHVIDYCEQAIELKWSKSTWIPDFAVLIQHNNHYDILILEVKYLSELIEKRANLKQKYEETKKWLRKQKSLLSGKISDLPIRNIEFIVVTDHTVNQSF